MTQRQSRGGGDYYSGYGYLKCWVLLHAAVKEAFDHGQS